MARGWESKSVESQIEEAGSNRRQRINEIPAEQIAKARERESLELSRKRVLHDLEQARNPRYRATLTQALEHLDRKLAELGKPS